MMPQRTILTTGDDIVLAHSWTQTILGNKVASNIESVSRTVLGGFDGHHSVRNFANHGGGTESGKFLTLDALDEVGARVAILGIAGEVVEKGVGVQENCRSVW
jgi:hypothetical protein